MLALHDGGAEAFPRMLAAISAARTSVRLETYLLARDATGLRFVHALSAAARRGVQVRVALDAWGSARGLRDLSRELIAAGCQVRIHAGLWSVMKLLARNHRKLLLVDDEVAFVGGINLADEYGGEDGWADLAVEIRGPACAALACQLRHERRVLPQDPVHIHLANFGGGHRLHRRYLQAIRGARSSIFLAQGYFLPNQRLLTALVRAARRGVQVTVLLPARSDVPLAGLAMRYVYAPLLAAGVHLREWTRSVLHAKAAVIDGGKLLVGSLNLMPLSLAAMEVLVEADEPGAAALGTRWMEEHLALARPVAAADLLPHTWAAALMGFLWRGLERLLLRNRERLSRRGGGATPRRAPTRPGPEAPW